MGLFLHKKQVTRMPIGALRFLFSHFASSFHAATSFWTASSSGTLFRSDANVADHSAHAVHFTGEDDYFVQFLTTFGSADKIDHAVN